MTRNVLCALLAAGSILLGLGQEALGLAILAGMEGDHGQQAALGELALGERERGAQLNERMERCRMLEGVTRDSATAVLAQDWGVLPSDPTILERAKLPKPAQAQKPVAPKGAQP